LRYRDANKESLRHTKSTTSNANGVESHFQQETGRFALTNAGEKMLITSWFILVPNAGKVSESELSRLLDFSFATSNARMRTMQTPDIAEPKRRSAEGINQDD
jgi:hypothetical protein